MRSYQEDVSGPQPEVSREPAGKSPATVEEALLALSGLIKGFDDRPPESSTSSVGLTPVREAVQRSGRTDAVATARYQALIEQIPAVTFLASLSGERNELYVSPQIERLLGFTQEEWLSDPVLWYRQTHPADRDRVSIKFARACATGEPFRDVIRVIARNGEVLWVNAEARLVRDADGEPLFLQGVGFDVTDQHRAQEIREELIREQAERAAQDRQREKKDEFLAAAAHDLKTPITAIKGLVQILERRMSRESDPVPEYVRSALPQVRKAADNVTKLVNQLLDVSRMDAGNPLSLNREVVDLVQLVSQVIDDHRSISDIHRLVFQSQCTTVMANIDAPRIERVVSNLLTNAIKYSPKGGQVTVRLNREDVGGCPEATIEVQDQGVGIPAADLPRIFERFHRGSNVQAHLSGTGIGLAYVQQVVSDHGGTIAVQSRESEGSRFTIHLPLEPGADA